MESLQLPFGTRPRFGCSTTYKPLLRDPSSTSSPISSGLRNLDPMVCLHLKEHDWKANTRKLLYAQYVLVKNAFGGNGMRVTFFSSYLDKWLD